MPITAITCWIGSLALIGTPFFSGFYSKDAIIEAVGQSHRWGATYAYWCVLGGVFVTALYTFRMLFMTFHGEERFRHPEQVHTSGADRTVAHEEKAPEAHGHGDDRALGDGHTHGDDHGHGPFAAQNSAHGVVHQAVHAHTDPEPHESPLVVTIPLIALAIPSIVIGAWTVAPVL